ncbi:hypothetical protein EW026_g8462 [Hermanssonia centrifuga]|uniref:Uncharacterized protein n=1 Tax=Hermanssonia centrifuga TaxID=98765 RepID=A0A4S4K8B9_9APHY|nr:hypothetical protein EW026_g8462 [Hermanssonia centrifuga]
MTTIYPVARSHQPSSHLYDVPSLENGGANFQTWKYRFLMILEMRELMGYVDGTAVAPRPSLPLQQSKYLQNDKEARAQITLTLKDEPLNGVLHTKTAKEAWDKLNTRYKVSLYDAHIQNGHVSYEYIKKALDSDHKYLGLQTDPSKMDEPLCEACAKGKISCTPIRKEHISNRAVNFGDILHMDLWGPSPVRAPGGFQYTFTILNEATGWLHEPKMRTKDEAFG